MNKIDIKLLQPLLDETLDIDNIQNRPREFNPEGRSSASAHGLMLFGIIASTNAKNVVELGVAQGGTTLSMLLATYASGGKLTCVDKGVFPIDLTWVPNLNLPNLKNHIQLIKNNSINFLENYNEEIDFILVDDWHNGDHVYNELELIKSKMSKFGVIALHDCMYANNQPFYNETVQSPESEFGNSGPYGGLKKFIENNKGWEYSTIPADHGLTILRKVQ
jgi:predicted O-methyltransferase YrrM